MMSERGFITPCDLRVLDQACMWLLLAPLLYVMALGQVLTIPDGFITDLASIPRLFRVLLDVNGQHRKAAVLHDYLYTTQIFSRLECDKLLLQAMEECGVSWWRRQAIYQGVRAGGWYRWNQAKKAL